MRKSVIEKIVDTKNCLHCGTCAPACNVGALEMTTLNGLRVPQYTENPCVDCHDCIKVCPSIFYEKIDKNNEYIGTYKYAITSQSTNDKLYYNSSSGGSTTSILQYMFENSLIDAALVVGFKSSKIYAEPMIVKNTEELYSSLGSVYQTISINEKLYEIENDTTINSIAVVGLPCHIQGLKKFLKHSKSQKKYFTIGLTCTIGRGSLGTDHLLKRFNVKEKEVEELGFRRGEFPGGLEIKTKDDTSKSASMSASMSLMDFLYIPTKCLTCDDIFAEVADISVGDPWGFTNEKSSFIIVRSDIGDNVVQGAIQNSVILNLGNFEENKIISSQDHAIDFKKTQVEERVYFYKSKGLSINKTRKYSIKKKANVKQKIAWLFLYKNSLFFNDENNQNKINKIPINLLRLYREYLAEVATNNLKNSFLYKLVIITPRRSVSDNLSDTKLYKLLKEGKNKWLKK